MLPGSGALSLSVNYVEDAHHAVIFMVEEMAVVHASADKVSEVRSESHVGIPRNRCGV